jgi:hypothetical protein
MEEKEKRRRDEGRMNLVIFPTLYIFSLLSKMREDREE